MRGGGHEISHERGGGRIFFLPYFTLFRGKGVRTTLRLAGIFTRSDEKRKYSCPDLFGFIRIIRIWKLLEMFGFIRIYSDYSDLEASKNVRIYSDLFGFPGFLGLFGFENFSLFIRKTPRTAGLLSFETGIPACRKAAVKSWQTRSLSERASVTSKNLEERFSGVIDTFRSFPLPFSPLFSLEEEHHDSRGSQDVRKRTTIPENPL